MASLGRLTIDMVANLAGFERDMGRAQRVTAKSMQSVGRDLRRAERDADRARASIQRLGMQFAALAGVSMAVLVREFNQLAEQGDRIGKVAQGTGATVEAIQRLGFAAEQSGTSQEVLIKGLQTLQRNLQGARDGLTTYTRAFERIGVSTEELFKLNVEDQFLLIADALSKVENATTRSASAQEIFGRAGKELLAFFADGSQSARDWGDALERAGAVMGPELVNDLENFNDQLNLLSKQFLGMKIQILENLIGPMTEFVEFLNTEEGTAALRETLDDLARTAIIVGNIIGIRLIGQLGVATFAFVSASIRAAQASMALAGMATTATAASGAFRGLGIAIRGMMGPLGIAATALGVFAISSKDSTAKLLDFNEQMRDLRYESRQFASEQQIIKDMQSFQDEADAATEQIEQLKSGLDKLAGDRKAEETLSQYNQRMGAVAEKTELTNAEIARLEVVAAEASEKARELGVELKNFETPAQRAQRAIEELNNELRDEKRKQFLRNMQDISDELEGPAMQAARKFAREIERVQLLLDEGLITPEEYANYLRGLAQLANRTAEAFNLADVIADSIIEGFNRIDAQTLLSGGFGAAMRVVGMSAFEGIGSKLGQTFGKDIGDNVGKVLGKKLQGELGEELASTIGGAVGNAMGAAFPVIGQVVGSLIGDLLFGKKSPKFQVGGTTGFFGTGGAVKGQFETAFGTQLFRFRNLEEEVKQQIQQALVDFDNAIASIITDKNQFGAIAEALKNFGYDSQDESASIQELLQQRFDAILGSFDQFTQNMVRQAYGLEAQIQRLAEFLQIQRMATFTGDMGFASQEDFLYEIGKMQRGTETLVDTFNRFVTTMNLLQKVSDLTGVQIRDSHGALIQFGDELLRVFGDDMQRFQASLNRIFSTFFDADEILEQTAEASKRRAAELLGAIGVELTDELLTVEGFRELFDNLLPQLSPEQVAILIEAGVAVADFVDATNELNGSVDDATDAIDDMSTVLSERAGLERRLAQLTGDTEALRQMELDAVDESNRHLLERIFLLEDEAAAAREAERVANERDGLLRRELQLLGDTEAIRQLELAALDESNQEILRRIFALEDEAEAAAKATAVANERAGLERRLYTLLGDTAALRQMELDSLDPANRELLERIFAIEDERAANEAAARSAEEAARATEQYYNQLNELIDAFSDTMQGIEETIMLAPLNDFQRELVDINRQLIRNVAVINQAARSAITQEQAERALARAHEAAAIQVQAAVARLEASTVRLVQEVFGTPLDEINRQIQELENNSNNVADAIGNVANAMQTLIDFADSLLIGNLSPLSSREQLTLGLEELRAASQAGDVNAVQALARQVLEIGRERFASGPEFTELFDTVQAIIRSTVPAEDKAQPVEVVDSPALAALYAERDRMLKEQADADRRANAVDIAQAVADIAGATGASFETVAKNLGIPLEELAKILGLDYDQIDAFLTGLQTDTMTLAQQLEAFATAIKYQLNDLAQEIIGALQDPIAIEVIVTYPGNLVDPVEVYPGDKYKPPKVPIDPPPVLMSDDQSNQRSLGDSGGMYDKQIERNTAETVQEIRRLVETLDKSSTRSIRTALA